jgi:hypothetical protein
MEFFRIFIVWDIGILHLARCLDPLLRPVGGVLLTELRWVRQKLTKKPVRMKPLTGIS